MSEWLKVRICHCHMSTRLIRAGGYFFNLQMKIVDENVVTFQLYKVVEKCRMYFCSITSIIKDVKNNGIRYSLSPKYKFLFQKFTTSTSHAFLF